MRSMNTMDMKTLRALAKEKISPACRVCPSCNGVACRGEIPGMGGVGTGRAFQNNVEALQNIKLQMRTIHNVTNPDTSCELWGMKLTMPILGAPIGGIPLNLNGFLSEYEYAKAILGGCQQAGTIGMSGDGANKMIYDGGLQAIEELGSGIPTIKPRSNEDILKFAERAVAVGAKAIAVDIDAAALINMTAFGQPVSGKTVEQLQELKQKIDLPLIIKGILHPADAFACMQAGVDAIVVSNHGGRVLDCAPGTAEILPKIKQVVGDKLTILVDGGIRSGVDVLKMIALGADVVLVGRPLSFGACGGAEGVTFMLNKYQNEMVAAMIMMGCQTLDEVTDAVLYK